MTYTALDATKPTTAQTRQAGVDSMRTNIAAVRDALIFTGFIQGFNYSVAAGTNAQPTQVLYKRSTEWIKVDITWGTTGGEDGNPKKYALYYSSNSGSAYDPMADASGNYVLTITYDANGDVSATTWGSTP
jgi:hypothetical protein